MTNEFQVVYKNVEHCTPNLNISAKRERLANEIAPINAESSRNYNDNARFAAENGIDMDLETWSMTIAGADGAVWFKLTLDKVKCVEKVIKFDHRYGTPYTTWTCTDTDCSSCAGRDCSQTLTVYTEDTSSDNLPSISGCKYGDRVKLANRDSNDGINIPDIAVITIRKRGYLLRTN